MIGGGGQKLSGATGRRGWMGPLARARTGSGEPTGPKAMPRADRAAVAMRLRGPKGLSPGRKTHQQRFATLPQSFPDRSSGSGSASGLPLNHYDALPAVALVGDDHDQAGRPYEGEAKVATVFTSSEMPPLTSTRILSLQPSRHFCRSLIVVGSYRVCICRASSQTGPVAGRHFIRTMPPCRPAVAARASANPKAADTSRGPLAGP